MNCRCLRITNGSTGLHQVHFSLNDPHQTAQCIWRQRQRLGHIRLRTKNSSSLPPDLQNHCSSGDVAAKYDAKDELFSGCHGPGLMNPYQKQGMNRIYE